MRNAFFVVAFDAGGRPAERGRRRSAPSLAGEGEDEGGEDPYASMTDTDARHAADPLGDERVGGGREAGTHRRVRGRGYADDR